MLNKLCLIVCGAIFFEKMSGKYVWLIQKIR